MKEKMKWLLVLLCLMLFAIMAIGSGSASKSEKKDVVKEENSEADTPQEDAVKEKNSTAKESDPETESKETEDQPKEEKAEKTNVTIEEQVLIDQDGIKITAMEYVTDVIWGDGIKLLLENSTDKNVTIGCNALIVNDFMITDLFVSEVAAGKKANEIMHLSSSELKAAGIDTVGKVEIYFHIYDSDNWNTQFDPECVTIKTSAFDNMDTTADDSGQELYNSGGIRIVGKTVDENSFWGTAILLYIENTSGKNVGINVDDMSINGYMMTPYFSTTVYDGKKALDDITIMSSELESNNIKSIDEVELKFHIYDITNFSTIADSDSITFSAK